MTGVAHRILEKKFDERERERVRDLSWHVEQNLFVTANSKKIIVGEKMGNNCGHSTCNYLAAIIMHRTYYYLTL